MCIFGLLKLLESKLKRQIGGCCDEKNYFFKRKKNSFKRLNFAQSLTSFHFLNQSDSSREWVEIKCLHRERIQVLK